jgi:hypothetical protein
MQTRAARGVTWSISRSTAELCVMGSCGIKVVQLRAARIVAANKIAYFLRSVIGVSPQGFAEEENRVNPNAGEFALHVGHNSVGCLGVMEFLYVTKNLVQYHHHLGFGQVAS